MSVKEFKVADVDEIESGERLITEVDGKQIAVFNIDGEYHALLNYCVHQSGPLCEGPITGRITVDDEWNWRYDPDQTLVTCPWHYWKFDMATGENVRDNRYSVPTYDVNIQDGEVRVVIQ